MGFRVNGFMTVWSVEPSQFGKFTKVRLSSSRKEKDSDEYKQDFSGFCTFIGKAHEMAGTLKAKDRIKILECDVTTKYNNETKKEFVNYNVYSFEPAESKFTNNGSSGDNRRAAMIAAAQRAASAEDDIGYGEGELPF